MTGDRPRPLSENNHCGRLGQTPYCVWLTGLPGAGKTTLAHLLHQHLAGRGRHVYLIDGDHVRRGLCRDLAFSAEDRIENVRRVAAVARMMVDAGLIVIASLISPSRGARLQARALFDPGTFLEVFVDAPLTVCERRDVKGLYQKARAGLIADFTGITSPYEAPDAPELRIDTSSDDPSDSVAVIVRALAERGLA